MKKKLDALTKVKLIYSGELLIFSIVFLVIAILEFTNVFVISERHHQIFNWLTIFGGTWIVADFTWMLLSKKRQAKGCLIDKITVFPLGIYLIAYDIVGFINYNKMPQEFYQYGIPAALSYVFVVYTFQAIYHWYHPLPELVNEVKKEEEEEKLKLAQTSSPSTEELDQTNKDNDTKKES